MPPTLCNAMISECFVCSWLLETLCLTPCVLGIPSIKLFCHSVLRGQPVIKLGITICAPNQVWPSVLNKSIKRTKLAAGRGGACL